MHAFKPTFTASALYWQTDSIPYAGTYTEHRAWARVVKWDEEYDILVSDGNRHSASASGYASREGAEKAASLVLDALLDRLAVDPVSRDFSDLLER